MTQQPVLFVHTQTLGQIVILTLELNEEAVENVVEQPRRFATGVRSLERKTRSRLSLTGDTSTLVVVGYAILLEDGEKAIDAAHRYGALASDLLGLTYRLAVVNGLRLVSSKAA